MTSSVSPPPEIIVDPSSSTAIRYVFLTSFSFLSAFLLRDMFQRLWEIILKNKTDIRAYRIGLKVLFSQFSLFMVVFIITLIMAMYWRYEPNTYHSFNI